MASTARYGSLPFREQIEFFRRKLNVNTAAWTDVYQAEHNVAFMVAGANRDDIVADFREAVSKAIESGATLEDFRRDFDRIVGTYGWDYTGGRNWRSRVIYETNLRQSYNAGRWEQLQRLKPVMPYWRYRHNDAVETPRPLHVSWDGLVLSADDPWWHTHFPANGWGCQCYVEGLSERDLRRLGKTGPDQAPPMNMQTVVIGQRSPGGPRTVQVPEGIDPGFAYAPGLTPDSAVPTPGAPPTQPSLFSVIEQAAQSTLQKTTRLPAVPAAMSASRVLALPRVAAAIEAGYAAWQTQTLGAGAAGVSIYPIGAIEPAIVRSLIDAGIRPATAAIVVQEVEIIAASNRTLAAALTVDELLRLPALLRTPTAVVLDIAGDRLLYLADLGGRGSAAVEVRYVAADTPTVNTIAGAELADLVAIRDAVAAGRMRLLSGSLD